MALQVAVVTAVDRAGLVVGRTPGIDSRSLRQIELACRRLAPRQIQFDAARRERVVALARLRAKLFESRPVVMLGCDKRLLA